MTIYKNIKELESVGLVKYITYDSNKKNRTYGSTANQVIRSSSDNNAKV